MKFTNRSKDFHEKNVLRKRIIPDVVRFENIKDILENDTGLENTVINPDIDSNPKLK